jgi:predicted DNA-binding transcriptional regulator AlpA
MHEEFIVYLPTSKVLERYGISDMTLWRWLHSPEMGFPQPALIVKRRRRWTPAQLDEFDAACAARMTHQPKEKGPVGAGPDRNPPHKKEFRSAPYTE